MMPLAGRRLHFMGIGGMGMSALAGLALGQGAQVTGCDRSDGERIDFLRRQGAAIALGHDPSHAEGVDWLICTGAVPANHPERAAAGSRAVARGSWLARQMAGSRTGGVAGTHGKTTTTVLLAQLCRNRHPAVAVGGVCAALEGGNYAPGRPEPDPWFIAELDESDGSFLEPALDAAILTNVESEHLAYYGGEGEMRAAFARFVGQLKPGAVLVAGGDCPGAMAAARAAPPGARVVMAGTPDHCHYRLLDRAPSPEGQALRVKLPPAAGHPGGEVELFLPLPGRHNALNALLALAAAEALGAERREAQNILPSVLGADRRLQRIATLGGAALYSDYAHHPTEVRASLRALRESIPGPILTIFQPHLYSRTRDYARAFGEALALSDAAAIVDIYAAREDPPPGVSSQMVVDALRQAQGKNAPRGRVDGPFRLDEIESLVRARSGGYAAVILMGAGDIGNIADALASPPS